MKKGDITRQDFLKALSKWNRCYMKKPRSWQKVWLWWERDNSQSNEPWFMNIARSTRDGIEKSSWITANDINLRLNYMESAGYKYHLNE